MYALAPEPRTLYIVSLEHLQSGAQMAVQRPSGQALWPLSGRLGPFQRPLSPLAPPKHEFIIDENK